MVVLLVIVLLTVAYEIGKRSRGGKFFQCIDIDGGQSGPKELKVLERFRFKSCHLKIMRGGIFLRKMPLGAYVSVKSRIETAVADEEQRQILRLTPSTLPMTAAWGVQVDSQF